MAVAAKPEPRAARATGWLLLPAILVPGGHTLGLSLTFIPAACPLRQVPLPGRPFSLPRPDLTPCPRRRPPLPFPGQIRSPDDAPRPSPPVNSLPLVELSDPAPLPPLLPPPSQRGRAPSRSCTHKDSHSHAHHTLLSPWRCKS